MSPETPSILLTPFDSVLRDVIAVLLHTRGVQLITSHVFSSCISIHPFLFKFVKYQRPHLPFRRTTMPLILASLVFAITLSLLPYVDDHNAQDHNHSHYDKVIAAGKKDRLGAQLDADKSREATKQAGLHGGIDSDTLRHNHHGHNEGLGRCSHSMRV